MVKGFKDANGKFHPIGSRGSAHSDRQKKSEGVRLRRYDNPMIQSLIFPKKKFTVSEAKNWARKHGFKAPEADVKENSIRLRQFSPSKIKMGKCSTIQLGSDVKAVLCDMRSG